LQNCRQELEAHAGKTITDVAFSWGFSSSSHFSRVFRKYFGFVPSSIHRAQHNGPEQGTLARALKCSTRGPGAWAMVAFG
jgi:AraC-like DNA-binding protein